jgi:hypothetical protein
MKGAPARSESACSARDELLAGAALALDEHGRVRRRHALEHGEDLAHGDRAADQRAEALRARRREAAQPIARVEGEARAAELEHAPERHRGGLDPRAADERPVAAAEVLDADRAVADREPRVPARDALVGQDEVALGVGADRQLGVERTLRALVRADDHHDLRGDRADAERVREVLRPQRAVVEHPRSLAGR